MLKMCIRLINVDYNFLSFRLGQRFDLVFSIGQWLKGCGILRCETAHIFNSLLTDTDFVHKLFNFVTNMVI
jgi:hypothetical protein